jgi:branched-chain amino acid transport system ATP-binding protein
VRFDLERVTAAYGSTIALRDVSLSVPAGRVVALLGPNGAGKTTLLSVASGLMRPVNGRVLVDRADVTGRSPDTLMRLGACLIPEGRSIFRTLTVRDNLRLFAAPGDEDIGVARCVDAFPTLGQRLDQIAGTMSGGEQQMLALTRAYARPMQFVMLDEVSTGLAPLIVDEIFEFLAKLAADGTSLLIVEQYVSKALRLADYVYLLAKGRVVYAGEPDEARDSDLFARYLGAEVQRSA